jgi:hypothetical protein
MAEGKRASLERRINELLDELDSLPVGSDRADSIIAEVNRLADCLSRLPPQANA